MALKSTRASIAEPPVASPQRGPTNWFGVGVRILISVIAIAFVLRTVDLRETLAHVAQQNVALIALALVITLAQIGLAALRWHIVRVRLGSKAPFRDTFEIFYVGVFFSTYVWGGLTGDVMRGWMTYRSGDSAATSINAIILDRVVIFVALALMMLAATPWFFYRLGDGWEGWLPSLLAVGLFAGLAAVSQLHQLPEGWRAWLPIRLALSLAGGVRDVFLHPQAIAPALAVAIVTQLCLAAAAYCLARSLSVDVTLLDCIVLMQVVALINAIPISIGGWGVREAAMVSLFGLIGIASSAALLVSVQLGLLALLANLPGGVIWLLRSRAAEPRAA